jgi:hypothetical protein
MLAMTSSWTRENTPGGRRRATPAGGLRGALFALVVLVVPLLAACAAAAVGSGEASVPVWGSWEQAFTAHAAADDDTRLAVTFTAPSGATRTVEGFWDGGSVWRVRFMPDEPGSWSYRTDARPAVEGLHDQLGSFVAADVTAGGNRFTRHGGVRVSKDGRHLAHADGTPFFWLADTGWNGALKSSAADWATYLADRVAKRFTAIQFVTTQWRTADTNAEGEVAYTGFEDIRINPSFFRRIDDRITAVNEAGLLAAPVLLWTLGDSAHTPGKLPEDQAIKLARYLVARYGAHHVAWFLAGDENFGRTAERWRRIGRAVFDRPGHALVTLHPQGMQWSFDPFADEPWLSFLIYQSGHGDDARTLAWIHSGPVAEAWRNDPPRPIINSEPPYEDHLAYQSRQPHSAYNVRRASYWSLLNAPTAGVTYGGHGIWSWETEAAVPLRHNNTGVAQPWHLALHLPGSDDMKHLAELFTSVQWWRLRPDQALLQSQPGGDDPAHFVAAARSADGDLAVLYLPVGGEVALRPGALAPGVRAQWFDPRDGSRRTAQPVAGSTFRAPDTQDWVLLLTR